MRHASLFSGIGGFDLAAEWMGWTNVFNCEWEDFPRKVLKHHFPNAIQYGDIRELDATKHRGCIDILTGGFPCQPYSVAGKKLGKDDERHLWPEMLRIIREVQPRYVVGENVLGITSWNDGMVFDEVQADMEAEGYEVLPFVLPAAGVGAPHRRDRVWFVACDTQRFRLEHDTESRSVAEGKGKVGIFSTLSSQRDGSTGVASNAQGAGREGKCKPRSGEVQPYGRGSAYMATDWEKFPTFPPVCGGNDGLPRELDGITFSKWRKESIKAYGNAIVPQVALQIFKAIQETQQ